MRPSKFPRWSKENLVEHFEKRLRCDEACWVEILNHPAPMAPDEYEKASYAAYARPLIEYEAEESRHGRAAHGFDARGIRTIFSTDHETMITCFHFHRGRRHVPGSVSAPLGDKCAELLDVLETRAEAGELTLFDVKVDKRNLPKGKLRSKSGPLMTKITALKRRFINNV